jgi:hypothetical protein
MTACRMLSEGEISRAVVVAAEELNELSHFYYTPRGRAPMSEGLGPLCLTGRQSANPRIVTSHGAASEFNPADRCLPCENTFNSCMKAAGSSAVRIDLLVSEADIRIPGIAGLRPQRS